MENWWIYLLLIVGLVGIYLLAALIVYLLAKSRGKKAFALLDELIPLEKQRFDLLLKVRETLQSDRYFLPKSIVKVYEENSKEFEKIPFDVQAIKEKDDILVMLVKKYLDEKRLKKKEKYQELYSQLEQNLFLDSLDKNSPYYKYNRCATSYNAFLNMGFLNPFYTKRKHKVAPIL